MLDALRSWSPSPSLPHSGAKAREWSSDTIFSRQEEGCELQVLAGRVRLNCHFFAEDEIEFDLDPRDVAGAEDLSAVLHFMQTLARTVAKPALPTPENMRDYTILTCLPNGDLIHHAPLA